MPVQVETFQAPRVWGAASEASRGLFYCCMSKMDFFICQIRWFVSISVFGISLTGACPFFVSFEISGCGMREGSGLMAADYLWGFCTGEFEMPVQVETFQAPRVWGAASGASRGLFYRCMSKMDFFFCQIRWFVSISVFGISLPKESAAHSSAPRARPGIHMPARARQQVRARPGIQVQAESRESPPV